jgi:hypothetical protein
MKKLLYIILVFLMVLLFGHCQSPRENGNGGEPPTPQNPIPTLSTLSPASTVSHLPSFTLTVTGTDFVSGSISIAPVFRG